MPDARRCCLLLQLLLQVVVADLLFGCVVQER